MTKALVRACAFGFLAVLISGCGGGNGSSPGGGPLAGTGTFFNAPLAAGGKITAINTSGQMTGDLGFYASPTSAPQPLQALAGGKASPTGINASGQIVGFNAVPSGDPAAATPLFWPTPTSVPTVLQPLVSGAVTRAWAINSRGQIVGMSETVSGSVQTYTPIYWPDSTAAPRSLPNGVFTYSPGGFDFSPYDPSNSFYIADDGTILVAGGTGSNSSSEVFKVPASASDPIQGPISLQPAAGASTQYPSQGSALSTNGIIAGTSAALTPVLWSTPAVVPQVLPVPAGFQAYYRYLNSINSKAVVVGVLQNKTTVPYLWRDGKALEIGTLLPTGTAITITGALLINDSGVVVVTGRKTINSVDEYFVLVPR